MIERLKSIAIYALLPPWVFVWGLMTLISISVGVISLNGDIDIFVSRDSAGLLSLFSVWLLALISLVINFGYSYHTREAQPRFGSIGFVVSFLLALVVMYYLVPELELFINLQ